MIRKLIKLSTSTHVVSLPNKWIKKNKLSKGSEINLTEIENRIIISSKSILASGEKIIDAKDFDHHMLWFYVDAAYTSGHDKIVVITYSKDQNKKLLKFTRYFPGLILYEEKKNKIVFKDIANNPDENIHKIVDRIFNINIDLLDDGIEAIKNKDWEVLKDIKARDYLINSYVSFCLRHLNKFGYEPSSKAAPFHTYLKILEMMSDRFCDIFLDIEKTKSQKNIEVVKQIRDQYLEAVQIHRKYEVSKILEIDKKRQKLNMLKIKDLDVNYSFKRIMGLFHELEELEAELNA